jgi:hypothetical protein
MIDVALMVVVVGIVVLALGVDLAAIGGALVGWLQRPRRWWRASSTDGMCQMIQLLRFRDLKARGVVNSWPQLKRLQRLCGFPLGRMLSPNIRAWTEEEVDAWLASRPIEGPEPRGAAKPMAMWRWPA